MFVVVNMDVFVGFIIIDCYEMVDVFVLWVLQQGFFEGVVIMFGGDNFFDEFYFVYLNVIRQFGCSFCVLFVF